MYGHLRPGTYDITSQRYDKNLGLLKNAGILNVLKSDASGFYIENKVYNKISEIFNNHGLNINAKEFFDFAKSALESRELSKFEFTKSLSNAIELIADAGKSLGFSRRNMSQLDVT